MSAYIVEQHLIGYLVRAARQYGMSWCAKSGNWMDLRDFDRQNDVRAANMLWGENEKSIVARYGKDHGMGPVKTFTHESQFGLFSVIKPEQVIMACRNYRHQSCEHEGWDDSEAAGFIRALMDHACMKLVDGMDTAWGAPPPMEGSMVEIGEEDKR